ncbi:MAG: phospholipase D/transphosphatidylase [Candidatus Peribacteria bacterium]|nr:phospholipase D/transphosphatidylase [Candidatus Peribacteria bacterium]
MMGIETTQQLKESAIATLDAVKRINDILASKKDLNAADCQEITDLLTVIQKDTQKAEKNNQSYFANTIWTKLHALFPDHPLFAHSGPYETALVEKIELLIDGKDAFEKIVEQIRTAQKSIQINIFIWRDDEIGNNIASELLGAANRGVKVTIVKDRLGGLFEHAEQNKQSFFHKDLSFTERMKAKVIDNTYVNEGEAKSALQQNNPLVRQILDHPNIRVEANDIRNDHSKYYIFDDKTLITGGQNIGDEYHKKWHDYMVKIVDSPELVRSFLDRVKGAKAINKDLAVDFGVNVVRNGIVQSREIKPLVQQLLSKAQEEVIIEMAYFGDKEISSSIKEAAARGVSIKILIPEKANVQDDLNKKIMSEFLQFPTIEVYYLPVMTHAKCIMVDQKISFLGSANLNTQATTELGETNILINDQQCAFTRELLAQLQKDLRISKRVHRVSFDQQKASLEGAISSK